jgi:hypothetical protein
MSAEVQPPKKPSVTATIVLWIIVLVAAALLALIPVVGWILALVVVVLAIAQQVRVARRRSRVASDAADDDQDASARPHARQPDVLPARTVTFPELLREEVVGESHRREAIAKVIEHQGRDVTARIDWDADNRNDSERVAVWLVDDGRDVLCGYLPRANGLGYLPEIRRLHDEGTVIHVPARIFGGEGDQPDYGIWIGQAYAS